MSNREQNGLRGPVKTCIEEATYAGGTAVDGTQVPPGKSSYETEYDAEGRLVLRRSRNSNGSMWESRDVYGASGRLLETVSGSEGQPLTKITYSYDNQGRLLSITNSGKPDNPVTFRYDERGKKTKVQVSRPEDYRANMAVAGSPLATADMPPNLPGGGSATTFYDENDRPIEVQIRDAQGEVVSRAIGVYDEQGRIVEEKQILDNPETIIPAEMRAKILEESGATLEELREHLKRVMGGQSGPFSIAYSYDSRGRIRHMSRWIFSRQQEIEIAYNEHGDKATEITRSTLPADADEQSTPHGGPPEYEEVRYSYEYDDYGNWTKEALSCRSNPDDAFQPPRERRRTLSYY